MERRVLIETEYITLGQFLKFIGFAPDGASAKIYLTSHIVMVNDKKENRRGRKLYPETKLIVGKQIYIIGKK